MICFGIESGDQGILDGVKKGVRLETAVKAGTVTRKANIRIKASYILGLPGDTEESCLRTMGFARKLDTAFAQFNLIVPYPGTAVFEEALSRDSHIMENWDKFLQAGTFGDYAPVYAPAGMDRMRLKGARQKGVQGILPEARDVHETYKVYKVTRGSGPVYEGGTGASPRDAVWTL